MKLRLCIRDSLFRLAQSSMQRQYAGDTFSTNKSSRDEREVVGQDEINSRNRLVHQYNYQSLYLQIGHLFFLLPHMETGHVTFINFYHKNFVETR